MEYGYVLRNFTQAALIVNFCIILCVQCIVIQVTKQGKNDKECLSGNLSLPCRTLDFVFNNLVNNTKILIGPGNFSLERNTVFEYKSNISIEGLKEGQVFILCESASKNVGFQFLRSRRIFFKGITVTRCRTEHTSTTPSHPRLYSAIFFAYCTDVHFFKVAVVENIGIGVTLFDVGGVVNFTQVNLSLNKDAAVGFLPVIHNRAVLSPPVKNTDLDYESTIRMESGGGVYAEFTSCGALDPHNCTTIAEQKRYNSNNTYIFNDCNFVRNIAEHKIGLRNDVRLNEQSAFGRGGGLTFLFKADAKNNKVIVHNCSFVGNIASWGAGYYIGLFDLCQKNTINIRKTVVKDNYASMAGGGARVVSLFFNETENLQGNDLHHHSCFFNGNRAIWGGGFSLTGTTRINPYVSSPDSRATFLVESHFSKNLATVGSAIGLNIINLNTNTIGPGLSYVLHMKDCHFHKNKVIQTEDNKVIGEGAVFSEEVTLVFEGKNVFIENNSTALVLDTSSIIVKGELIFERNSGIEGGALALYGNSWIMLHRNCKLLFLRNQAFSKGGAIYVKTQGPERVAFDTTELETGNCFFKYADAKWKAFDPNKWKVSVKFINNTAANAAGNAVYASTLQHCRMLYEGRDQSTALYWKPFYYEKCGNGQPEVVTNAIDITFDPHDWKQPPGVAFNPKLKSTDEKNNSVFATVKVNIHGTKKDNFHGDVELYPSSSLFLAKDELQQIELVGREGDSFSYQFVTTSGQQIQTDKFYSKLVHCPVGYAQMKGDNKCTCLASVKNERGVLRCNGLRIFLQPGYWGDLDSRGKFYTVTCPEHYCTCCEEWSKTTPKYCVTNPDIINECEYSKEHQCENGRYGPLCSKCLPGTSVLLGSESCSPCSNTWLFLLIPMGILGLAFVLVILYFDLHAFSGYLNAFMYSYQIITLLTADSVRYDQFAGIVIGVTGLSGTGNSQLGVCLYNGFDNLQKLGFNYVLPCYLILCTCFVGLCLPEKLWSKIYRRWDVYGNDGRRTSFGYAISFISVLCYSAFTSATLNIFHWVSLDGQYVVFQAGNVKFLGRDHLPYFIGALLVLVVIVIGFPIVLIFTPYFTAKSRLFLKLDPAFTALKNCFKDGQKGSKDRRAFSAFYFICRFVILLIGVFMQEEIGRLVLLTLTSILIQSIFSWFQPYKKWTMNFFDILLLTNLSVIGVLSVLLTIPNYLGDSVHDAVVVIIQILVYLPLITVVCRGIVILYYRMKQRSDRSNRDMSCTDTTVTLNEQSTFGRLTAPLFGRRQTEKSGRKFPKHLLPHRAMPDTEDYA